MVLEDRWSQIALDLPGEPGAGEEPHDLVFGAEGPLLEAARRALGTRLASLMKVPVQLVVTNNRCSLLSATRREGTLHLRLHHMFLDAPDTTVQAVARYVRGGDRRAGRVVDAFIHENELRVTKKSRESRLQPLGLHHDLAKIFQETNHTWFGSQVDARITWGRRTRPRGRSRRSLRLGVYVFEDRLIRLHPVLDQAFVPDFFVRFVVFHEMLHAVTPPERHGTRVHYHSAKFRARERAYPDYDRAISWEKCNLSKLLRSHS